MLHRRGLSVPFPSRATWWEGRRSIKHERDAGFPYADNADAVTEAVKNKGRRGHGTSARSNAVTAIKTAIVKKSQTLSCSLGSYVVGRITVISSHPAWPVTVCC